jgi:pyrimidine 5'-nucleotidase
MRFTTIFFDLDDTLYPSHVGLWSAIKERMNVYMRERLSIPEKDIPALREKYYLTYGTTMRGLQKHHDIDTQDFLAYVHDLPLAEYLSPDMNQRAVLAALAPRRVIFTNADISHAHRVLTALNLRDLFRTIVDVNAIAPYCKPMHESFKIAPRAPRASRACSASCIMTHARRTMPTRTSPTGTTCRIFWRVTMDTNKAVIGALLFIVMVLGANLVMYGIVRGWTRSSSDKFLETLGQSFNAARKKEDALDELRRKMEELENGKKE